MDASNATMDASPKRMLILLILLLTGLAGGMALYFAFDDAPPAEEQAKRRRPLSPEEETAQRVMQLARQGASARAVGIAEAWIAEQPDDVAVRTALAQVMASNDRAAEAEALIDKALSINPSYPGACWMKGLLHGDEPARAGAWFAKAAEQDDAGEEIWGKYGLWLMDQGAMDQAGAYLQRAIEAGNDRPSVLRAMGEVAWRGEDYARAVALLERAVKRDPRDPMNWSALAEAQALSGDYEAAAGTLRGGLDAARGPAMAALHVQMGEVLERGKQYDRAAAAYVEAVRMGHMTLQALIGAARSHHRAGQYAEAMGYIDRAYALAPENGDVIALRKQIEDARFVRPGGMLEFNPKIENREDGSQESE